MATMRDIRRRIRTVGNIQQITNALKMVASAQVQRAQSKAAAARPYADNIAAVMRNLAAAAEGQVEHPLLAVREPKNIGLLVITSDKGMAGSYNTNVVRTVIDTLRPYSKDRVKLVMLGKKGRLFFSRRGYNVVEGFSMPSSEVTFTDALNVSNTIRRLFEEAQVDVVYVVYTKFISIVKHLVTVDQVLPAAVDAGEGVSSEEYQFEPAPEVLLGHLLPKYVDTQIYRAMVESLASEQGARMTAMSSATDNAAEMIERLTLDLNRARQAAITKELAEIVSGAQALK
ncbi:MAG TPA: ATP synthase F1 subunit gamma [Armatimonadetes bacterium]|jgi:F-type H+-transporting ATPase subunit gamma|nr:ATP synthase F1 subunit gamma [Armatimonadota bacterium]